MTEYNISEIQYRISERINEIRKLREKYISFIGVDAKMRLIIDPGFVNEAKSTQEKIDSLQASNLAETALLVKLRELVKKYNFVGGYFATGADVFTLDGKIQQAEAEFKVIETNFGIDVLRLKMQNPPAAEALKKEYDLKLEEENKKLQDLTNRINSASKELQDFLKCQSQSGSIQESKK